MKRLTRRDPYTGAVFAQTDSSSIRNKLAEYEEAEERGEIMAVSAAERRFLLLIRSATPEAQTGACKILVKESTKC